MTKSTGFTLIEVIIVLAIIAILSMLALPDKSNVIVRTQIAESIKLIDDYKPVIKLAYQTTGSFPVDNSSAGLPAPEKIKGNYVDKVDISNGGFNIVLGAKIRSELAGKIISIRPIYVKDSLASPVSWICGDDSVPKGMAVAGNNKTDLPVEYLPMLCR